MNIFRKRPLSLILCIALGVFFLFTFQNRLLRTVLIILAILPLFISIIPSFTSSRRIFLRLIGLVMIIAIIFSFVYFDLYFSSYNRFDGRVEITGTVTDISLTNSYTTRLTIRTDNIDKSLFSKYNINAYFSKSEAAQMPEGTQIKFEATLHGFSADSKNYNTSIGISAYASDIENLEIIAHSVSGIHSVLSHYKEYLSRYVTILTDSESGALLSALLFGERDYLSSQLRLDFQRIGISHILALSGMHLAILSLGFGKLLSLLGIKKKSRLAITSIFILLYMALTGFSVSVMRAGFMVIIASLLFILSHSRDTVTSLVVAVTIICILDPCAIFSTSLWLSAFATLGIIVLGEYTSKYIKKAENRFEKLMRPIIIGMLASIFAISATLAIATFTFGGISLIGIVSTLIFSVIIEILMYLGCLRLLLGKLLPIGWLISVLTRITTWMAEFLSNGEFIYLSTNYIYISIAVIIYTALFYLFVILPIKKKKRAVLTLVICFVLIISSSAISAVIKDFEEDLVYFSDSKCDELLIRSKNEVCLINSSQYAKNIAYTSLDLLEKANVTYLDKYYLTHYSWSIDDELKTMLSSILVEKIYLPTPRNDDEETIIKVIKAAIKDYRTKIILLDSDMLAVVGDYQIELLYSVPYGEGTSMNAYRVMSKNEVITYISSGLLNEKVSAKMYQYIANSNTVILGEHGKKYKKPIYLHSFYDNLDHLIINSTNVFLTQTSMQNYIDNDCILVSHPENKVVIK
ncbi:MAG: ComEC/Rec2 family competence protein [Ruminococcaceae bacterium]|nr:ComEC/Rec2 family competence protein [Oscillospiraceae bacterium]